MTLYEIKYRIITITEKLQLQLNYVITITVKLCNYTYKTVIKTVMIIIYNIVLCMYKALSGAIPVYVRDFVSYSTYVGIISSEVLVTPPVRKTEMYVERALQCMAIHSVAIPLSHQVSFHQQILKKTFKNLCLTSLTLCT